MGLKLQWHSRWFRLELDFGRPQRFLPGLRRVRTRDLVLRRRLWLEFWTALRAHQTVGDTPT